MTTDERRNELLNQDLIAHKAAQEAVREVFFHLGVNVEDPVQVEDFRKDLRFGGQIRKAAEKGFIVALTTGLLVVAAAAWFTIVNKINGGD